MVMHGGRWVVAAVVASCLGSLRADATTTPSRNPSTYVILGVRSIKMKDFAFTNLGNVGVSEAGGLITWGKKSFFADGSQVTADVLARAGKNSSLYDLFANTVVSPPGRYASGSLAGVGIAKHNAAPTSVAATAARSGKSAAPC